MWSSAPVVEGSGRPFASVPMRLANIEKYEGENFFLENFSRIGPSPALPHIFGGASNRSPQVGFTNLDQPSVQQRFVEISASRQISGTIESSGSGRAKHRSSLPFSS